MRSWILSLLLGVSISSSVLAVDFESDNAKWNRVAAEQKTAAAQRIGKTYWVRPPTNSAYPQFVAFRDSVDGLDREKVIKTEQFTVTGMDANGWHYQVRFADGTEKWIMVATFDMCLYTPKGSRSFVESEIFGENPANLDARLAQASKSARGKSAAQAEVSV